MERLPSRRAVLGGAACVSTLFRRSVRAAAAKNRLSRGLDPERLTRLLVPRARWKPFPLPADRAAWQSVPQDVREPLIAAAEKFLGAEWPSVPATAMLEFVRTGNRTKHQGMRGARRSRLDTLVLAECFEARGR